MFSGMKAFHELNEAFPSLLDENGRRKPFERFLNDVRAIDSTYNANYLRAEYNFVAASAEMAARWEGFVEDGDRYNLQYRATKDGRTRPEHAALDGVTLPVSDPMWAEITPPNGWNCRCLLVQVLKSRYPVTDRAEVMRLAEQAFERDTRGMFRFNPGTEGKSVPDYNPYTISRCRNCDIAKGITRLARFIPENQLCEACVILREYAQARDYTLDEKFGECLRINNSADKDELEDNIRAAHSILSGFPEIEMTIRPHVIMHKVKNPEYTINGLIADRKGIESEKGITSGFQKALKQGCKAIVIDLDMNMRDKPLRTIKLAQYIDGRKRDFENGLIKECYVVYRDRAVKIDSWSTRKELIGILEKLRP